MNYSLFIRPDALSDIEEAAKWYEERKLAWALPLCVIFSKGLIAYQPIL